MTDQSPPSTAQDAQAMCARLKAINRNYDLAGGIHATVTQAEALLCTQAAALAELKWRVEYAESELLKAGGNWILLSDQAKASAARVAVLEGALTKAQAVLAMMTAPDAIKQTTVSYAYAQAVEAEQVVRAALEPK